MKKENTKQPKIKPITYQEVNEIYNQLRDGDYQIIAEVTDYAPESVRAILKSRRKNRLVIDMAKMLNENREHFINTMKPLAKAIREGKYNVTE